LATLLAATGCSRGCGKDRPYTPYAVDGEPLALSAVPSPATQVASGPGLGGDAGNFVHVVGQRPGDPGGGFRIEGDTSITPPEGEAFILVFAADVDGDGVRDGVAWAASRDALGGRLLYYKGGAAGAAPLAPKQLATLPGNLIGLPGCTAEPALEQIGPQTVAVSVHAACNPQPPGATKVRWVAVAAPAREPALREEITLADPPAGAKLHLELDASDFDGDRRDDLVARVALEGAPAPFEAGPRVTADLRWLDRPTGLSRDPEEPEASLKRTVSAEQARVSKKNDGTAAALAQVARLYAWLCADSGTPLLAVSSGAIRCGASKALEDLSFVAVRAALAQGDVPRAVAAFEHLHWRPVTTTKPQRAEIEKVILKAAPATAPSVTRVFATVPDLDPSGAPAWGPLTFTPGGDLLVRTKAGLSMINVSTGSEGAAQGIPSWPSAVTSPDGSARWLSLYDACDGAALRVRFGGPGDPTFVAPPSGDLPPGARDLPVPVLPPVPARCTPGASAVALETIPLAWGAAGLEAWMGGEPVVIAPDFTQARPVSGVGSLGQNVHAGSPRSPDGRSFARGTKLGVLVRGPKAWQMWRPADLEGAYAYADLRGCTAANDARAVACVRSGRLIAMLAPASP
jgi:hypothetical protein